VIQVDKTDVGLPSLITRLINFGGTKASPSSGRVAIRQQHPACRTSHGLGSARPWPTTKPPTGWHTTHRTPN